MPKVLSLGILHSAGTLCVYKSKSQPGEIRKKVHARACGVRKVITCGNFSQAIRIFHLSRFPFHPPVIFHAGSRLELSLMVLGEAGGLSSGVHHGHWCILRKEGKYFFPVP